MISSKTGRKTSSVALVVWHVAPSCWNQTLPLFNFCSVSSNFVHAVLLKPNVANVVLLFNFCKQKFVQHGPITIAIHCNDLSLLISEEKCLNYTSGPKSAPNSDSFWACRLFNVCLRVFCATSIKHGCVIWNIRRWLVSTSFCLYDQYKSPKRGC